MNERDDLLRRVARVNPYPSDADLPNAIANGRPPVDLLINDQAQLGPVSGQHRTRRVGRVWRGPLIAGGTAAAILLAAALSIGVFGNDSDVATETPIAGTTAAIPTTLPPSPDPVEGTGTAAMVAPPIEATWTLAATVYGGWLTEPVVHNGGFLATHKSLAEGVVEGVIHIFPLFPTDEGRGGQLWESADGVTWAPASSDQEWPPPPTEASMTAPAVIVEYEGDRATERVGRLLATSDGSNWREINLRPYEDNWIPRVAEGGLGWLVYSPPMAAGAGWSGPRASNHGLWYTPDTEAWFEVTDLGPLAGYADIGEVGIWDIAMIVRDDDILLFAYIAENLGFGNGSQHRTDIWRLNLAPKESGQAFDFSTQSLCNWFSPEQIDAIVTSTYEEVGVPLNPGDEMDQRQDQNSDCFWASPLVALSEWEGDLVWDGTSYESHPVLDDSVVVSIRNPGSYGLMHGIEALLRIDGHAEPLWFGHSTGTLRDVETINTLGLTIANNMLQQMGWIETN